GESAHARRRSSRRRPAARPARVLPRRVRAPGDRRDRRSRQWPACRDRFRWDRTHAGARAYRRATLPPRPRHRAPRGSWSAPPMPPRRSPPPARPRMDARRRRSPEELLHALDERGAERPALLGCFLECLQRLALLGVQPGRHLEHEAIARIAAAAVTPPVPQVGHTAPAQFQELTL